MFALCFCFVLFCFLFFSFKTEPSGEGRAPNEVLLIINRAFLKTFFFLWVDLTQNKKNRTTWLLMKANVIVVFVVSKTGPQLFFF